MRTDWASAAPKEIWRRRIGPGWSSFAVAGDLIFTQEQRGEQEVVSAYRLSTGAPVWRHQDNARFYDTAGGAGPRGTPTVHNGRVYTMGATGIVNALDATTGARVWTRNAQQDTGAVQPGWGFAASPVVYGDLVITAASGRLVAYNVNTGAPKWTRTTGGGGYSSPHLATIDGVEQILLQKGGGVIGVALDGTVLWDHKGGDGVAMLQPVVLGDGSLLVASADMMVGLGVRRLQVSRHDDGSWKVEERWMSRGLKPYFDDYVAHKGHAYGFDGTILSAINLETGERVWKGGRYGNGQLLLLPDQDLLLVTSEQGEVVLVAASPDKQTEIAKFKAIEGTTWNHPVLVGDVLLVRNGEEMAAFRLPK
jgi:outer membrane protein assembly factor BamB